MTTSSVSSVVAGSRTPDLDTCRLRAAGVQAVAYCSWRFVRLSAGETRPTDQAVGMISFADGQQAVLVPWGQNGWEIKLARAVPFSWAHEFGRRHRDQVGWHEAVGEQVGMITIWARSQIVVADAIAQLRARHGECGQALDVSALQRMCGDRPYYGSMPECHSARRLSTLLSADEPVTGTVMSRDGDDYTVYVGDGLTGILSANGLRKSLDEGGPVLVRVIVGRADGTCDLASEEALASSI